MPDQGTAAMSIYDYDEDVESLRESIRMIELEPRPMSPTSTAEYAPPPGPPPSKQETTEYAPPPGPPPNRQTSTSAEQYSPPPGPPPSQQQAAPLASSKRPTSVLPMVLPQLSADKGMFGSPFARAYPIDLERYGITKTDFLTFLDGLNETFVSSQTAQSASFLSRVLNLAYGHRVIEVDTVSPTSTRSPNNVASATKSYGKVLLYLQAMNKDIFHPAGLHIQICKTEDMISKVGLPASSLKLLPIDSSTKSSGESQQLLGQRMQPLEGYVGSIDLSVSPSAPASGSNSNENLYSKMAEARHARKEKLTARRTAREQRLRDKAQKRAERRTERKAERKSDRKSVKADSRLARKLERLEADLLEAKERAETRLSQSQSLKLGDAHAKAVTADFERRKARIVRDMDRLIARGREAGGEDDTKQGDSDEKSEKKSRDKKESSTRAASAKATRRAARIQAATARAEMDANKVQWLVISPWGIRFDDGITGQDDGESSEIDISAEDYLSSD